jgi:copper chaperone CopZ
VSKLDGVTACTASHVSESVDVTAPPEQKDAIVAAIKKLGYKPE